MLCSSPLLFYIFPWVLIAPPTASVLHRLSIETLEIFICRLDLFSEFQALRSSSWLEISIGKSQKQLKFNRLQTKPTVFLLPPAPLSVFSYFRGWHPSRYPRQKSKSHSWSSLSCTSYLQFITKGCCFSLLKVSQVYLLLLISLELQLVEALVKSTLSFARMSTTVS